VVEPNFPLVMFNAMTIATQNSRKANFGLALLSQT
jgi:hypothetical protein